MAAAFKNGDQVRLKAPTIAGPVTDIQFNKDVGELEYLVSYPDPEQEDGTHERWFLESELEGASDEG
jgi:hypothetical protein